MTDAPHPLLLDYAAQPPPEGATCWSVVRGALQALGGDLPPAPEDAAVKRRDIARRLRIGEAPRTGDLVLFRRDHADRRHVGVYAGGGRVLHHTAPDLLLEPLGRLIQTGAVEYLARPLSADGEGDWNTVLVGGRPAC